MANTDDPQVTADMTLAEIEERGVLMLQRKVDPRGSTVSEADTITSWGACVANFHEDWLLAAQENIDDLKTSVASLSAGATLTLDTRGSAKTTTGSIAAGASGNFSVTTPAETMSMLWLRVVSVAGSEGGTISFYRDPDRTYLVYSASLASGDPVVDTDDFVDGTPWTAFDATGTGLLASRLYGTIENGGSLSSTYTIELFGVGYPS